MNFKIIVLCEGSYSKNSTYCTILLGKILENANSHSDKKNQINDYLDVESGGIGKNMRERLQRGMRKFLKVMGIFIILIVMIVSQEYT